MNIAVTGCFGSGKSTVSKILARELAARYLDTDRLCREFLQPQRPGYLELVARYGSRFLTAEKTIDRVVLRHAVFSTPEVKNDLEAILHPLVRQLVAESARSCDLIGDHQVVEVPLLFEVGWQDEFDTTVVVSGDERQLRDRVRRRDGLSFEEIQQIAASQLPAAEKERLGKFVVNNGGTLVATVAQVAWLARKLSRLDKLVGDTAGTG